MRCFHAPVRAEPGRHGTFADCEARLPYDRRDGFRCRVSAADSSDRHSVPQGNEQPSTGRTGRRRQSLGHRLAGRRAQGDPPANSARSTISTICSTAPPDWAWRSRSTSLFSVRPTIPRYASIRNGSAGGPTARSSTPRIRPRNTRTSIPLDFETEGWRELWDELLSVMLFWVEQGVRIFRVDNPHTKPFAFWEWLIGEHQSAIIPTPSSWPRRSRART